MGAYWIHLMRFPLLSLLAAIVAALIISIVWPFLCFPRDDQVATTVDPGPLFVSEHSSVPSATEEVPPAPTSERRGAMVAAEGSVSGRVDANEPTTIEVRGTIVVVDAEGAEYTETSGSMVPFFYEGSNGTGGDPVDVVAGHFELEMLPTLRLGFDQLMLDERAAFLEPDDVLDVMPGEDLELHARRPNTPVLRIVDVSSGVLVSPVEIVRCSDWRVHANDHPGCYSPSDVVSSEAPSPVRLTVEECRPWNGPHRIDLWVRSPGYAWRGLGIDFLEDTERTLGLKPAAELVITVENLDAYGYLLGPSIDRDLQPVVRARRFPTGDDTPELIRAEMLRELEETPVHQLSGRSRPSPNELRAELLSRLTYCTLDGRVLLEGRPAESGPIVFEGLEAGRVAVTVEVGDWFDERVVLGWAIAHLEVGKRREVTLRLESPPQFEAAAPLAGTLFLPRSWGEVEVALSLRPVDRLPGYDDESIRISLGAMKPVAGRDGLHRWSAGEVIPRRYEVLIPELGHYQVIRVPRQGLLDAHVGIGERATVLVHVLDRDTGEPAAIEEVYWSGESSFEGTGVELNDLEYDDGLGGFRFQAPIGRVTITTWDGAYRDYDGYHDVHPGENELTVYVERTCGMVISVQGSDPPLRFDEIEEQVLIEPVSGPGEVLRWEETDEGVHRVQLSHPGRYEVRLDPIAGYAPVAPQWVEVPPGGFVEHIVGLKKAW